MPKPIGLLYEAGILAMTWEAGQPMTATLLSGDRQSAGQCGTVAGDWLRRFHQLHSLTAQTSEFQGKLNFIRQELDLFKPVRDPLLQHASRVLEKHLAAAAAVRLPVSWIFSDFKSDNLLVRDGRAVALDAQLEYENTVIHDIVPFLIHLELLRWSPRGLFRWCELAYAGQRFLAAYSPLADNWRLPIAWLKTEMLLQRGIATAKATSLGGYIRRATIRRALARATNDLERSYLQP